MTRKIKRKGQEEIVGFVAVMLVVAVVMLVFLLFSVQKGKETPVRESVEIFQFVESALKYTTDCGINYVPPYLEVGQLVNECYRNKGGLCVSGEEICSSLNKTLVELLESSWAVGEDKPIKGYVFNSSYKADNIQESVFFIQKGTCEGELRGSSAPSFGGIDNSLHLCY